MVTVLAFFLILWMHGGDTVSRFQNVLLFVGYWIPAFVAIVTIDWYYRARGRHTINPARESTVRADAIVALITFVVAFGAAVPFMDTSIIVGPVAKAWDGADVAYFVNFVCRGHHLRRVPGLAPPGRHLRPPRSAPPRTPSGAAVTVSGPDRTGRRPTRRHR